ncbi:MAG: nucleoside 2-deoxyribosyltransferase [Chloroflexi bacterium]|nr:nucleoside 2-deoxyribosyltransferase [Chloroflexota bacterium]
MNIYFACSITGGRKDEIIYQSIIVYLVNSGHNVPTAFLAQTNIMMKENNTTPSEIFTRDTSWIHNCDCLIAEISTPSHGVGYEIGYALNLEKPVLCLHHCDTRISKMISGNPHHLLTTNAYATTKEAITRIDQFLTP